MSDAIERRLAALYLTARDACIEIARTTPRTEAMEQALGRLQPLRDQAQRIYDEYHAEAEEPLGYEAGRGFHE
ncbi:hypothetical protein [Endothiovibrio diazotrophicus]